MKNVLRGYYTRERVTRGEEEQGIIRGVAAEPKDIPAASTVRKGPI